MSRVGDDRRQPPKTECSGCVAVGSARGHFSCCRNRCRARAQYGTASSAWAASSSHDPRPTAWLPSLPGEKHWHVPCACARLCVSVHGLLVCTCVYAYVRVCVCGYACLCGPVGVFESMACVDARQGAASDVWWVDIFVHISIGRGTNYKGIRERLKMGRRAHMGVRPGPHDMRDGRAQWAPRRAVKVGSVSIRPRVGFRHSDTAAAKATCSA